MAHGVNNVLPLPKPTWKTQIWLDDDKPLRAAWELLQGGKATVQGGTVDEGEEPGWHLVGDEKRRLLEVWFWRGGEKLTLKASGRPRGESGGRVDAAAADLDRP